MTGSRQNFISSVVGLAFLIVFLLPAMGLAQIDPQIRLIRCVDDDLGISLLCSREWDVKRSPLTVKWTVVDRPEEKVEITVAKSQESGLTYDDLVPSALQYVYGYADGFRFGRKKIRGQKMVAVEGFLTDDPSMTVLDYFIIDQRDLFRIRYRFSAKDMAYRYQPLFQKILNSLRFER